MTHVFRYLSHSTSLFFTSTFFVHSNSFLHSHVLNIFKKINNGAPQRWLDGLVYINASMADCPTIWGKKTSRLPDSSFFTWFFKFFPSLHLPYALSTISHALSPDRLADRTPRKAQGATRGNRHEAIGNPVKLRWEVNFAKCEQCFETAEYIF